jgi:hypothetical protein
MEETQKEVVMVYLERIDYNGMLLYGDIDCVMITLNLHPLEYLVRFIETVDGIETGNFIQAKNEDFRYYFLRA